MLYSHKRACAHTHAAHIHTNSPLFYRNNATLPISTHLLPLTIYPNDQHMRMLPDLCLPGKHQVQQGSRICDECPRGTFTESTGNTDICTMCPKGYYQNHTGKTRCDVCLPGFHQTQRQATACDACNAGAFTDRVSEGSNCSSCPSGFQQKLRGQALCLPCIPGKYASVNGSKSCASCPKGWLQDVVQGTRCRKAKPAHIAADGGATETEIAEGWRSINWELR